MDLLIVFYKWLVVSSVNINTKGTSITRWITYLFKKMCDRGCFSQMGDVLFTSLRVSKLQKLEKGSILRVHNGVHLTMEVAPLLNKNTDLMLFTVNERS